MKIELTPVAVVRNSRKEPIDDHWAETTSEIHLLDQVPIASLNGIEHFSHLEIVYFFHRAEPASVVFEAHPRGNTAFPNTGIFAQRKKDRPNGIGTCVVSLLERGPNSLLVHNLDAIDGTPMLDIKPVFKQFLPYGEIRQPAWVDELMKNYWR